MIDVYPRSNLPDRSVDWGRAIEDQNQKTAQDIEILRAKFESDSRYLAGQMGAVSRNLQGIEKVVQGLRDSTDELQGVTDDASDALLELQTRSSVRVDIPNLTNTVNPPVLPNEVAFNNSLSFHIPPPLDGKDRDAILYFSAQSTLSPVNMASARIWATLIIDQQEINRIIDPANPTVPSGVSYPFHATIGFRLSQYGTYGSFIYSGTAYRVTGAPSGNRTVGFTNFDVFAVIGDEV